MKTRRTLKIRVLRAALSTDTGISELAERLAQSSDAHVVEIRGHTFVMTRKRKVPQ